MKFPVSFSQRHKGKTLDLDPAREVVSLLGVNGEPLGNLSWDFVIDQILAYRTPYIPRDARTEPRAALSVRVRYNTPEGSQFDSRANGIGGGGLFIESLHPLPVGTKLAVQFTLPDNPSEWLHAMGTVAWVCPKPDQYTFSPGMGVQFTDIAIEVRNRILALVRSVDTLGQSA